MKETRPLNRGDRVEDRYVIDGLVGSGGMGKTYLANDERTDTEVALKVLNFSKLTNWKAYELFEREIEVLKSLRWPSIPNYVEHFKTKLNGQTQLVLVQEHVAGKNLFQLVRGGRRFSLPEVEGILVSLLKTLDHIHSLRPTIVHRDINPKNVVLDRRGRAFLVDFGAVGHVVENTLAGIRSNTFVGTLGYMPPEQLYGKVNASSDLYSLGVTILFLLTGKEPMEFELKKLKLDYQSQVTISGGLRSVLDRMIEPDQGKRISSARKALRMLKASGVGKEDGEEVSDEAITGADLGGVFEVEEEEETKEEHRDQQAVEKTDDLTRYNSWITQAIKEKKASERREKERGRRVEKTKKQRKVEKANAIPSRVSIRKDLGNNTLIIKSHPIWRLWFIAEFNFFLLFLLGISVAITATLIQQWLVKTHNWNPTGATVTVIVLGFLAWRLVEVLVARMWQRRLCLTMTNRQEAVLYHRNPKNPFYLGDKHRLSLDTSYNDNGWGYVGLRNKKSGRRYSRDKLNYRDLGEIDRFIKKYNLDE